MYTYIYTNKNIYLAWARAWPEANQEWAEPAGTTTWRPLV